MPHRIYRSTARPDVDGSDIHTAAVFLLSFLLMGVVGAILLTAQTLKMPELPLSENRIIANILGGSKTPSKLSEAPKPVDAPATEAVALEEQKPEPPSGRAASKTVKIANTGGTGVYVRRTPSMSDRLVAWPDNTILEIVGEDRVAEGQTWRNIKDPAGNVGWVPTEYVTD